MDGKLLCSHPEYILSEERGDSPFSDSTNAFLTFFSILPKSGSTTTCSEFFLSFIHTPIIILYGDYVFANLFPLLDYELLKNKGFILLIFAFLGLGAMSCT